MRTPVAPTPELDKQEVQLSFQMPHRFDDKKILQGIELAIHEMGSERFYRVPGLLADRGRDSAASCGALRILDDDYETCGRSDFDLHSLPAVRAIPRGIRLSTVPAPEVIAPAAPETFDVSKGVDLHWLDGTPPPVARGVSWGVPWPEGAIQKDTTFGLTGENGSNVPIQTWPLAYWPDGSIKWTARFARWLGRRREIL